MTNVSIGLHAALLVSCMLAATDAFAQGQAQPLPTPVDPSAIGRGLIDRQRVLSPPEPRENPDAITGDPNRPAVDEAAVPASVTFPLRAVNFDPSTFLSRVELNALAAPRIGQTVSFADLRAIAAEVNALYAARRIVTARAYVPPQRIADGTVRIALVEGRLGALNVGKGRYTDPAFVRSRLALTPGQVVDLDALRRQINRFNRGNDLRIQAQLQPGAQVGLTDVLISLTEPPRNGVQLFADTYGYESTGRYQGGVALRRSRLLTDGDRFNLYASVSDGGVTGSASYSIAVREARLGITYARSQIRVTRGPSANLDIEGFSDTTSLNFAHPVVERDGWYASFIVAASYVSAENRLADTRVGDSRVLKATAGTALGFDFVRGGSLAVNLTASPAGADDLLEPQGRNFVLFNGDYAGAIPLGGPWSLRVAGAGQHASTAFIPSNQLFQIGGPGSVRGFQPGTVSGSGGYFTQTELHYQRPLDGQALDLFAFFDHGKTWSADFPDRALASAGAGVRLPVWRFTLDAMIGLPITDRLANEKGYRADARLTLAF